MLEPIGNRHIRQYAEFTHIPFPFAKYVDKYAEYVTKYAEYAKYNMQEKLIKWQYSNMAIY
jgi:hypothetical protein